MEPLLTSRCGGLDLRVLAYFLTEHRVRSLEELDNKSCASPTKKSGHFAPRKKDGYLAQIGFSDEKGDRSDLNDPFPPLSVLSFLRKNLAAVSQKPPYLFR